MKGQQNRIDPLRSYFMLKVKKFSWWNWQVALNPNLKKKKKNKTWPQVKFAYRTDESNTQCARENYTHFTLKLGANYLPIQVDILYKSLDKH